MNNKKTTESEPDRTPDEIHKEALAGIEVLWKSKQINFGEAQRWIARADQVLDMSKKLAPEASDMVVDGAINHLWRTGRIDFRGVRKISSRATIVRRIRTRIIEKAIRAFIGQAVLEGVITEGKHITLMEFLLESFLEDCI